MDTVETQVSSGAGNKLAIAVKMAQRIAGKTVWSSVPFKYYRSKKCLGWIGFSSGKGLGARLLGSQLL